MGDLLPVVVPHDEAGVVVFLDGPRRVVILVLTVTAFALRNEKPRSRCCVGRRPGQWTSCGGRPDDNMAGDSVTEALTAHSTHQGSGKGKRRSGTDLSVGKLERCRIRR